MAPETTRVQRERHAGRKQQLPDLQARSSRGGFLEVVAYLVGGRRPYRCIVERRAVTAQDSTLPLRSADYDLSAVATGAGGGEIRSLVATDAEGYNLAEPVPVILFEYHVRAGLELESVERRLIGEAPPVDRGRQWKNPLFELSADGPVAVEALLHVDGRVAHGRTLARPPGGLGS